MELCSRCDVAITLPGWKRSLGSRDEVASLPRSRVFHGLKSLAAWLRRNG